MVKWGIERMEDLIEFHSDVACVFEISAFLVFAKGLNDRRKQFSALVSNPLPYISPGIKIS
jgi:hypothetical protein